MKIFEKRKVDNLRREYYLFGKKVFTRIKKSQSSNSISSKIIYDEAFYAEQSARSYRSAQKIVGMLKSMLPKINSVCDIGCGVGTWLKAWQELNENIDIIGVDGNTIKESSLYVKRNKILIKNLEDIQSLSFPRKSYDLVECLEVVEHLPEDKGQEFVKYLTNLSDLVLFSAAIPKQGGVNHINEKPLEYWNLYFKENNYVCFDILREKIWNDEDISWWYRQNLLIYAKKDSNIYRYLLEQGFKYTESVNTYYHPNSIP